jgi:hypothetical protein
MIDVSPFWRTLDASDRYIARSCENFTASLARMGAFSFDKPADEPEAYSVGTTKVPQKMAEMDRATEAIERELSF